MVFDPIVPPHPRHRPCESLLRWVCSWQRKWMHALEQRSFSQYAFCAGMHAACRHSCMYACMHDPCASGTVYIYVKMFFLRFIRYSFCFIVMLLLLPSAFLLPVSDGTAVFSCLMCALLRSFYVGWPHPSAHGVLCQQVCGRETDGLKDPSYVALISIANAWFRFRMFVALCCMTL